MTEHDRIEEMSPPSAENPVENQAEDCGDDEGPIEGNGTDPTGGDRPPTAYPPDSGNDRRLARAPR
jgi:hypothetical protein